MADVIANVISVRQREDHEIMSCAGTERARAGRLGFLVLRLAVNNRGRRFAGIFADALPDAHHVAAGRVDDLAPAVLDLLLDGKLGAEGRDDDHVVGPEFADIGLLVFSHQVLDA